MSEFFIGQVMLAGFNYPPKNFAACQGQVLQITQNTALFSLLGTQFGGNGVTTFALPELRGRTPIGFSATPSVPVGRSGGAESVTLTLDHLAYHGHRANASTAPGDNRIPVGRIPATAHEAGAPVNVYGVGPGNALLNDQTVGLTGGGGSHPNMQPYLAINFCIALVGIYPLRP